ncbi:hypothetical protein JCM10213_008845 [Rhodosporidiobolus nylandii]
MNPPPADAFTSAISYRPGAPPTHSGTQQGGPQRNNSGGGGGGGAGARPSGEQPREGVATSGSKPPPLTLEQSKAVARTHYSALKGWLAKEGALASGSTRTNARDKLTRLTRQQFQELSTDVYDELMRRTENASGRPGEQPFLAVRPEFHPKRNQARQKLATLPILRFRDLASDVYYELDRRYPEFAEEDENASSPPASSPTTPYGASSSQQQQQQQQQPHSRTGSQGSHSNLGSRSGMASPPFPSNLAARRAPTPQQQSAHSPHASHSSSPSVTSAANPAPQSVPAGNDVVVPNKSTMIVEEPAPAAYTPSGAVSPTSDTAPEDRRGSVERSLSPPVGGPNFGVGGRSLLASPTLGSGGGAGSARSSEAEELADRPSHGSVGRAAGLGLGGHQSKLSETSSIGTRFFGGYAGSAAASEAGGRRSWDYDAQQQVEKVKSEYEYKLTMLQNRVAELERENEDAAAALRGQPDKDETLRERERELRGVRERFDDQSAQLRSLQQAHDALRASSSRSPPSSSTKSDPALHARLSEAEDLANELRGEVSSLVDELRQVNERCEELQREVDAEREAKEQAEREGEGWKSRWQAAKMELRNIKATSQLFSSSISVDADYMPASSDGLIKDTSVAAFQTSIDDLLQAARSKEPSSVLTSARAIVSACEKIDNDVQAIPPNRLASLPPSDQDLLNSLKAKVNATLSNLMTASKNHAMSFGVSPVSLLDAAASHLAATVVELVRILKIRRTAGSGSRGSLDPSSAFGSARNGAPSFQHEPMPPLPEHSSFHRGGDASPDVGPAPPAKEQREQAREDAAASTKKEKSAGYLSGGMSSILGGGAGSMTKALGAMGISSAKRTSVDSQDSTGGTGPARQAKQDYASREQPRDSTTAASDMSLDSSSLASPLGAPSQGSSDYSSQQRGYDGYSGGEQQNSYPSYGQQQHQAASSLDVASQGQAYRSNSPSYSQRGEYDGRASLYGQPEQHSYQQQQSSGRYEQERERYEERQESYGGRGGYGEGVDLNGGAGGVDSYGSPGLGRSERNPEELRAYIENQTEAIVHSIQSLLSTIRSGASGSELTDNLTQIITIVSSIVAISREALPASARGEGDVILQDLITHCDKLSEMQNAGHGSGPDAFTKQTKQAMAAASFGVAKQLKQLNGLVQGQAEEGLV